MARPDLQPPKAKSVHTPFAAALTAGMAQRVINPPVGIRAASWGAAKIHVATGIHNNITTTAMAVRDESGKVQYLVTVDL